jgi:thioredoxin 1
MAIDALNKNNFYEKAYISQEPVLIEFYSPQCSFCQMFTPILSDVAQEYNAKKIFTINVDEERELAQYYQIKSVPTTLAMKQGAVITRCLGCLKKETILQMFEMAS